MCVSWKYCVRICALREGYGRDNEADGFQSSIFLNYYHYSLEISVTMWSKTCLLPCFFVFVFFLRFTHIHPQSACFYPEPTESVCLCDVGVVQTKRVCLYNKKKEVISSSSVVSVFPHQPIIIHGMRNLWIVRYKMKKR